MAGAHCGPLPSTATFDTAGCALVDMDALVASSNHLRNMQRALSRVPQLPGRMPPAGPVELGNDERLRYGPRTTRTRRSAAPATEIDRFSSEIYPVAAPYVPPAIGAASRWASRGVEVTAPK